MFAICMVKCPGKLLLVALESSENILEFIMPGYMNPANPAANCPYIFSVSLKNREGSSRLEMDRGNLVF